MLGNMDMIGVCDIALVRDAGNNAEALLQALGKLIGGRFQRRTVEAEINVVLRLPGLAGIVHMLHDGQGERLCFFVCM